MKYDMEAHIYGPRKVFCSKCLRPPGVMNSLKKSTGVTLSTQVEANACRPRVVSRQTGQRKQLSKSGKRGREYDNTQCYPLQLLQLGILYSGEGPEHLLVTTCWINLNKTPKHQLLPYSSNLITCHCSINFPTELTISPVRSSIFDFTAQR